MAPYSSGMHHLKSFGGMVKAKVGNFGHHTYNQKFKRPLQDISAGVKKFGESVSKIVDPQMTQVNKSDNFANKKIPGFEGMQSDFIPYLGKRKADIGSLGDSMHKKIKKGVDDAVNRGTGFASNLIDSMNNAMPGVLKKPM